jgi:hypothetical protein
MKSDSDMQQANVWEELYLGIVALLSEYGIEDHLGHGDYLVVDDNYGWRRNTIEIHRLNMLDPVIVKSLQSLLNDVPDWEIVIAVDIPGTEAFWPRMGLTLRSGEIVDDLQRQYFPKEFQIWRYDSSTRAADRPEES